MTTRFLTICLCALLAMWLIAANVPALASDTGTSEASISFTALPDVFSIATVSPNGDANAMNISFAGMMPDTPDDSYRPEAGLHWLKVTNTTNNNKWNVTATMVSFIDDEQAAVFNARLRLASIESYRQVADNIADDGTGLSNTDPSWPAATLVNGNAIALVSEGASEPFAEAIDLGRGHFFFKFPADQITLDQIDTLANQSLKADISYTAVITWTGTPVVDN